jgi:fused signal recognition particle receptor
MRNGITNKNQGIDMAKISFAEKVKTLFSFRSTADDSFFDDLTDALVEGDIGAKTAVELVDSLRKACRTEHLSGEDAVMLKMKQMLLGCVRSVVLEPERGRTNVWMVLGVNGVGKTTTVAKIAAWYGRTGFQDIVLAAADTFRAAAIEQLRIHGDRIGIRVVSHQDGADPAAVVYDAAESVASRGGGLVLADTAGRLHNKENLVRELQKIDRTAAQKASAGCYRKLLVIDATTGQNALRQAEVFNAAIGLDALVLTKYDSTAKGGVAISIGRELNIPLAFICTGEHYEDIALFDAEKYVNTFLGV